MTFGERLKMLREKRGLTQDQVGFAVGKTGKAVWAWENDVNDPRMGVVERLAEYFNVPKSYLMGEEETASAPFGKSIDDLIPRASLAMRRVPILGDTAAGEPIVANRVYDEYVEIPDDSHHYDCALRVQGDSMAPKFQKGDLAFIRYQDDVRDGEIAAVCIDDTVTLKRVYHIPNGLQLLSENPAYPPQLYTADETTLHLVGLAMGVLHWDH